MKDLKSLDALISEFCRLPGVGEKSAQRLAYYVLKNLKSYPENLSQALFDVKNNIKTCSSCFSLTEKSSLCSICDDPQRSFQQICVVEESFDIEKIESFGKYRGRYHVLGGSLSPLQGIGPEQLRLEELRKKISLLKESDDPAEEIILALDADLEGDTTALYIAKLLNESDIKISRLAHGIPFGMDIDYIDQRTLGRAFENRIDL